MRAVVTGVAGFIGSHLAERLVREGHEVLGIDSFTPYYEAETKRGNLSWLLGAPRFELVEADLRVRDPRAFLVGADAVFHEAAQPGVRLSWSEEFALYDEHNVLVTQRLLDAAKDVRSPRFVFASSSSVYGNAAQYPTREDDLPRPHSPYGVTKLAAEHLCNLYAENWGLPTVSLRYFTVYGPRQRPDMAIHRVIQSALTGTPFTMYGRGDQVRDFTFVSDVVAANIAAAEADTPPGTVMNIAGGSSVTLREVIDMVGECLGADVPTTRLPEQPGDVERTGGAIDLASRLVGWAPQVALSIGLRQQLEWHNERHLRSSSAPRRAAAQQRLR